MTTLNELLIRLGENGQWFFNQVSELKNNPDFTQRVCQTAAAAIRTANIYSGNHYLSKVADNFLNVSSMHNFLTFLKIPRNWTYYINASRIDVETLTYSLKACLRAHNPALTEEAATQEARDLINTRLKYMKKNDLAYSSVDEFKNEWAKRQNRINDVREILDVKIIQRTLVDTISATCFAILDLLCVPLYLQIWEIYPSTIAYNALDKIGLGNVAADIGKTSAFQWLGKQNLDRWAWSTCLAAFATKFLEAARILHDEQLTPNEKRRLQFTAIASLAEVILSAANLAKLDEKVLVCLTIITKSIGLINIAFGQSLADLNR